MLELPKELLSRENYVTTIAKLKQDSIKRISKTYNVSVSNATVALSKSYRCWLKNGLRVDANDPKPGYSLGAVKPEIGPKFFCPNFCTSDRWQPPIAENGPRSAQINFPVPKFGTSDNKIYGNVFFCVWGILKGSWKSLHAWMRRGKLLNKINVSKDAIAGF